MVKKAVSSGSVLPLSHVHKIFGTRFRRGPRNDIQIVQLIAWTNVSEVGIAERGAYIYE
jgi:hypothetical protein